MTFFVFLHLIHPALKLSGEKVYKELAFYPS